MTATDPRSLAGIEGLLLECSPGVLIDHGAVAGWLAGREVHIGWIVDGMASLTADSLDVVVLAPLDAIELDLMHKTGRTHAAWYVDAHRARGLLTAMDEAVLDCARRGSDLPPGGIERLRDLVLLAAGRTSAVATAAPSER